MSNETNGAQEALNKVKKAADKLLVPSVDEKGRQQMRPKVDADYLKWIRNTANDYQILELRNELRAHRANQDVYDQNAEQHEVLRKEAGLLLRMVGYLIHVNEAFRPDNEDQIAEIMEDSTQAQENILPHEELVAIVRMGGDELNSIVGLRSHIATTDDGSEWIIAMTREKGD